MAKIGAHIIELEEQDKDPLKEDPYYNQWADGMQEEDLQGLDKDMESDAPPF